MAVIEENRLDGIGVEIFMLQTPPFADISIKSLQQSNNTNTSSAFLAQTVERWPFKPMAVGSIPTEGDFLSLTKVLLFCHKTKMVTTGLEPATLGLLDQCSTN